MIPQLSLLFEIVLVPRAVRREFYKRRAAKDQMRRLFKDFAFVQPCNDYEQAAVEVYLIERTRQDSRDQGEAEAVVQAAQFGASVMVDDAWGREIAEKSALEVHGTFWLMQQFYELGLLSASATRESFVLLRVKGRRLPWSAINSFLGSIGQPEITGD
jgi:predicted nucleic acid-binding protein